MFLGLIFCLAFAAGQVQTPTTTPAAQNPVPSEPFVERNQKEFSFYPGGKVQFETGVPGNLKVEGWDRSTVVVKYERVIYALPAEEARALASKFPVQVRWTQTLGTIRTLGPPKDDAQMEINFTIWVPKLRTDLNIRMLRGDLSVADVTGWVEATLTQGSVEVSGLSGYFSAITQQGDLNIRLNGKHWTGHSCTGATQRGTIALTVPREYSAALQLETHDGDISIDYPEQLVEGESVPLTAVAKKKGRSLSATVGDGGAPIRLKTGQGSIHLTTP